MHKENRISLIDCELMEISVDTVPTEKFALVLISAQPVSTACRVREATTVNYLCSFYFHQEWGTTEVTTAINRVVSINKAKSFLLLILGMSSREELVEMERKLSGMYKNVTSKLITLVMPIKEDGKLGKISVILLCSCKIQLAFANYA